MKTPINEKDILILMADRYTRSEAINSLLMGTIVSDDLEEIASLFDVTVDEIREGTCEDIRIVNYEGTDYVIAVAH